MYMIDAMKARDIGKDGVFLGKHEILHILTAALESYIVRTEQDTKTWSVARSQR